MATEANDQAVLVNHDGELADVLALLTQCGMQPIERLGPPTRQDCRTAWSLVIASPKRMMKLEEADATRGAVRMAILDSGSRTLLAMLQRMAIDFIVRRPVHPAALRLLILHSLYRGPEKRKGGRRAGIGAPVRFRCGLRKRSAVLVDLGFRGCRLLSAHAVPEGAKLTIYVPVELAGRRPLSLKGKVKRCRPAESESEEGQVIGVVLAGLSTAERSVVGAILEAHAKGPVTLREGSRLHRAREPQLEETGAASERRTDPRRAYDRRVIALAEDATRVLLGLDISLGGMRVNPSTELARGDRLRLAVHAQERAEPLVVDARVIRDDGEQGLVLEFEGLSDEAREHMQKMIHTLPILASREEGGVGVVVSQILEREASC